MHNSGSNVKHWRLKFRFLTATGALLVKQIGKTDANKSKLINIVHQQRALEESRHFRLQRAFLLIWPPSNVVTKCRVLTSRAAFAWRSKLFPVGLPNNFIAFIWGRHLAVSIGRLVIYEQLWTTGPCKIIKIIKNRKNIWFAVGYEKLTSKVLDKLCSFYWGFQKQILFLF